MLSLQMQLIKSEAFGTVSVCQCDSSSNNETHSSAGHTRIKHSGKQESENRNPQALLKKNTAKAVLTDCTLANNNWY